MTILKVNSIITVFNLSLLASSPSFGSSKAPSTLDAIKTIVKEVRKSQKAKKVKYLSPDDTKYQIDMDVCVSCKDVLQLTKQVNNILEKMPNIDGTKNLERLELGNLQAMYHISKTVDSNGKIKCHKTPMLETTQEFRDVDKAELNFVFSDEVDNKFVGAQLSKYGKKTVWLRGKGLDTNKVVRVDITNFGKTNISYYTINTTHSPGPIVFEKDKEKLLRSTSLPTLGINNKFKKVKKKSFKDKSSGEISLASSQQWSSLDEKSFLKMNVGANLEYSYYVPKKIQLVDIQATAQLPGDYQFQADVEVSSKETGARAKIQSDDGTNIIAVELDKDGILEASAPYGIEIYNQVKITGELSYTTDGTTIVNNQVTYMGNELFYAKYSQDPSQARLISIGRDIKISKHSEISIKYEHKSQLTNQERDDGQDKSKFWISYSHNF